MGRSQDEMDAAGADMKVRGARADEFLQVLKAIWMNDPAEYHGRFFYLRSPLSGLNQYRSHLRRSSWRPTARPQ